ncbi:MAG: arsenate reductase ArsC, partial [Chloroflexota bacterium]
MASKERVLFLCTGNSARSQMAQAFLRKYAGEVFEAHSAGLDPKSINPYTVRVMEEIGIDLDGQYSKSLRDYLGKVHCRYLITVCAHAEKNCPRVFPSVVEHLHWEFEDPAAFEGPEEARLQKFRDIRDQIDERLKVWLIEKGVTVVPN